MNLTLLAIPVICLYMSAALLQCLDLKNDREFFKSWVLVFGALALVLHAWMLHDWIDLGRGQNLSFFNMLSLLCWLVALLVLLLSLFQSVEALILLIFPVAALSVVGALLSPSYTMVDTAANPPVFFHILVAVLSFGVLCIAGMQALILMIMEPIVRRRSRWGFSWRTPPLQSMEHLLFQTIWLGFILLSLVLVSSLYSYHEALFQQVALLQKTILASLAWVVFAMLLLGRKLAGWRGRRVTLGTLGGILVLIVAYLGTKIIWNI